ncbi:hypothetical protein PoMZ_03070 [Pyricularia oryzae]|uniref:Uncharacterized protein n=1 Tax=Pyricularia oryzae TaxID=318829 RepID=A0A4P7N6C2_PYROR|nr:hypothetical protein PoMZ_03070 [Pyricularia oryzae]
MVGALATVENWGVPKKPLSSSKRTLSQYQEKTPALVASVSSYPATAGAHLDALNCHFVFLVSDFCYQELHQPLTRLHALIAKEPLAVPVQWQLTMDSPLGNSHGTTFCSVPTLCDPSAISSWQAFRGSRPTATTIPLHTVVSVETRPVNPGRALGHMRGEGFIRAFLK